VYSEHHHLAQMVAFMGPPPTDFLQRSEKSKQFWDDKGDSDTLLPVLQVLTHH
jgi:serine/threonine-protein kinase SRPK3